MKEKILTFLPIYKKKWLKYHGLKKELQESTVVVLVVCLILAVFVYVIDTLVSQAIKGIF